jgi:hypothetical protein
MINTIDKVQYTGRTSTNGGRDGAGQSSDGALEVKLGPPGSGRPGTNPEPIALHRVYSSRRNQPLSVRKLIDHLVETLGADERDESSVRPHAREQAGWVAPRRETPTTRAPLCRRSQHCFSAWLV